MSQLRIIKNFMKSTVSGKNKFVLVALLIVALGLYAVMGPLNLLSVGGGSSYTSAYEGAKASFAGITYNGMTFASNSYAPYYSNTGTGFSFKGDGPSIKNTGLPKLVGEMTSVFIPQNTNPGDLPSSFTLGGVTVNNPFTSNFGLIQNPYHTYSWNISRGSSTTLYQMEEWKTKFYVSISANPDGSQSPFSNSQWDQANGRYSDAQIWIKLDTAPTWYFEGQEQCYFAIAEVKLGGISYKGHDADGAVQSIHNEQLVIVNPSSASSVVTLWDNNFGKDNKKSATTEQIYSYRGVQLNQEYFGDSVYFCITLNNFGSQSWGLPLWDWRAQGDVVTFDFTITQFIIGQWTVQNIQQVPSSYGRQSSYSQNGIGFELDRVFGPLLGNPLLQLFILGVIVIVIIVLLAIFVPGALNLANVGFTKGANRLSKSGKNRKRSK